MKWSEVNHEHDGLTVEVKGTTNYFPGQMSVVGRISCERNHWPTLLSNEGKKIHTFAGWYDVEIIG